MMGFVDKQIRSLSGKLSPQHVKSRRDGNGQTLFCVEGWHVIAEANRIFGFDAWDRQTLSTECVWQGAAHQRQHACSYVARVRVTVRAGAVVVCREASGSGHGIGATPGAAHESAIKEAETDAMKPALITFGTRSASLFTTTSCGGCAAVDAGSRNAMPSPGSSLPLTVG